MKQVKSKSGSFGKTIGAIVLAAVFAVGGAVAGWYAHAQNWFGLTVKANAEETGGLVVTPDLPEGETGIEEPQNPGIRIAAARMSAEEAASAGVSELSESAYSLTAAVTPEYADQQQFDWTVQFNNAESEWASGKTASDYVTVTPASDGAATATVSCSEEFAEPMTITCTVRGYDLTATCSVDYAQRITGMNVWFERRALSNGWAADGHTVDIAEGAEVSIPLSHTGVSGGSPSQFCYELKAEPVLSEVYTLAETPTVRVSFLSDAVANDGRLYFVRSGPSGIGGSYGYELDSVPDALLPWVYAIGGDGNLVPHTPSRCGEEIGAFYYFDLKMLMNFGMKFYSTNFASGSMQSSEKYFYEMTADEIEDEYVNGYAGGPSGGTILWRVAASVTGTYGTYTREESYITYYWSEYDGTPNGVDLSDDSIIL